MAKAKKSDTSGTPKEPKPGASKTSAKKTKPAANTNVPQIDTSLAASTAAKLIAAKAAGMSGHATPSKESAAFKNLKQGLAGPAGSASNAMANLLDKAGSPGLPKTHHTPFGVPSQVGGRNQTFGADVNRTGVPRRTGGG